MDCDAFHWNIYNSILGLGDKKDNLQFANSLKLWSFENNYVAFFKFAIGCFTSKVQNSNINFSTMELFSKRKE